MKALIQSHFPQRKTNLRIMISDLLENGLSEDEIILLLDYPTSEFYPVQTLTSTMSMPINWWHSVASIIDTDYVALLCDDLTLRSNSLQQLKTVMDSNPDLDVLGYEGAVFADTDRPYQDTHTHTVSSFEYADFVIRFYFSKPSVFMRALENYYKTKDLKIMDDLLLCIGNKVAIAPTNEECGWDELFWNGVAYSTGEDHYQVRDEVIKRLL